MSTGSPYSPDQLAALEFKNALRPMEDYIRSTGLPELANLNREIGNAALLFGMCDRAVVQAEREAASGKGDGRAPLLLKRAQNFNDAGIDRLEWAMENFGAVSAEIVDTGLKVDRSHILAFASAMKDQIGDLQIKPSDITILNGIVEKVADDAMSWSTDRISTGLQSRVADYIAVRKEPDRGVRQNIPVHKIIGLLIFAFGWLYCFLVALFRQHQRMSTSELASILSVMGVAWLVAAFC